MLVDRDGALVACCRLRVAGAGAVHDVRDAGNVLVQHRVHVHVGAVPHLHAQLHALHLLGVRARRLAHRAADAAPGECSSPRTTSCACSVYTSELMR